MPLRATSIHGVSIPCLLPLTAGGTRPPIILADSSIVIGSGDSAQIRLKSLSVSKAHALLLVADAKAYVRDLASRTELFVNDVAVREAWLNHGDVVRVGRFGFGVVEDASVQGGRVGPLAPAMVLRVEGEAEDRRVTEPVVLIGRRAKCDLSIADDSLSGAHAILFRVGARWYLRDLSSRTGTFVNGTPVRQQRLLAEGDVVRTGRTEMRFLGDEQTRTTEATEAVGTAKPVEPLNEMPTISALPVAAPTRAVALRGDVVEVMNPVVPTVRARPESATPPAGEPSVETPIGTSETAPPTADATVPPIVGGIELEGEAEGTPAPEESADTSGAQAPTVADEPATPVAKASGDDRGTVEPVPELVKTAPPLPAPRHAVVVADVPTPPLGDPMRDAIPIRRTEEVYAAASQDWTGIPGDVDDSAVGVEYEPPAEMPSSAAVETARGGRRSETIPSDTEWEQTVTVWSFEDLARRSSADGGEEEAASSVGRPLVWAAVAAGLASVGVIGAVLAYKLL